MSTQRFASMIYQAAFVVGIFLLNTTAYTQDTADKGMSISIDLSAVKIEEAMQILSDSTGLNIIVSKNATGNITAYIYEMEAERALQEIIEVNGFHYIKKGDVVWVLSDEEYYESLNLGLERRIVRLKNTNPDTLKTIVESVGSAQAKVIPYPSHQVIVLVEKTDQIDEVLAVIEKVDSEALVPVTRVFSLQYAAADQTAQIIAPHLTLPEAIQIDFRTNQVIIHDTQDKVLEIENLIEQLDIPDLVLTKSIPLKYANARDVAELIKEILTGRKQDSGSDSGRYSPSDSNSQPTTIATAKPAPPRRSSPSHRENTLKGVPATSAGSLPKVTVKASPSALAYNMVTSADESLALGPLSSVSYDERTNTVIITHTESVLKRLEGIIAEVDVPSTYHWYQFQNVNPAEIDVEGKLVAFFPTEQPFVSVDPIAKTVTFRSTDEQSETILKLLNQWDTEIRQVRIQAEILLVKASLVKDLGVKWSAILSADEDVLTSNFPAAISDTGPQLNLRVGSLATTDYTVMLQALATDNDTQLIASPLITLLDGAEALFTNARQEPYTVVTVDGNTQTTIQDVRFLDVGVTLSVQATINQQDLITLNVILDISNLVEIRDEIPVVDRSTAQSSISINNNDTIILGGLRQHSNAIVSQGVPVLRNIPVLGNLFKNNHSDNVEFETILILHPTILQGNQEYKGDYPEKLDTFKPWDLK